MSRKGHLLRCALAPCETSHRSNPHSGLQMGFKGFCFFLPFLCTSLERLPEGHLGLPGSALGALAPSGRGGGGWPAGRSELPCRTDTSPPSLAPRFSRL